MILTPWPRLRRGFSAIVTSLFILAGLAACSQFFEPPMHAPLVARLEAIETGTATLEASFSDPTIERMPLYENLDAQAEEAIAEAQQRQALMPSSKPTGRYGIATAGFMRDYRETLADLAALDRVAATGMPPLPIIRLRLAALRDALDDAIHYETVVLARRYAPAPGHEGQPAIDQGEH